MSQLLSALCELQTGEGLFPTYVAPSGGEFLEVPGVLIPNVGIHSMVLNELLMLGDPEIHDPIQRGVDWIVGNAVEQDGFLVWKWLKDPPDEINTLPPDYDDTAVARSVLHKARNRGFSVPDQFASFNYRRWILPWLTPSGLYTFAGDWPVNSVCPVVNANVLRSYTEYLNSVRMNPRHDPIYLTLRSYLAKVAESPEFQGEDFHELSRFYRSHMLLAYVLSEQADNFEAPTHDRIRSRVEEEKGEYKNPLEAAWGTLALINLNGDQSLIQKGLARITGAQDGLWKPETFYDYPLINQTFCSTPGTSIFCIKALHKADEQARS